MAKRSSKKEQFGYGVLLLIPAGIAAFTFFLSPLWDQYFYDPLPYSKASGTTITIAVRQASPGVSIARGPAYGQTNLRSGFDRDPWLVQVAAGGSIDARAAIDDGCSGFISRDPTYNLDFRSGGSPLYIAVEGASGADTTLVVHAPDRLWHCDDDSGTGALDPEIVFSAPSSGNYVIWVGNWAPGGRSGATLSISEPLR